MMTHRRTFPRLPAHTLLQAFILAVLGACGSPASTVRVIDRVAEDGSYTTVDAVLETLEDRERVAGTIATFVGMPVLDIINPPPRDLGASRDEILQESAEVSAQWVMDGDVMVPSDFDSLTMFSAYAHLETAATAFAAMGVASAATAVPIFYRPIIPDAIQAGLPITDNAAYFPNADAFLLLPMQILQDIPFAMNAGVMTHEYAHRVFYYEAWGGNMFRTLLSAAESGRFDQGVWNLIRATDEGVADFYAAHFADHPRFLDDSVFESIAKERHLDITRNFHVDWVRGLQPTTLGDNPVYDPYALGSVVASTLWAFAEIAGRQATAEAVLVAMRQVAVTLSTDLVYEAGQLEAEVIAALDPIHSAALCLRVASTHAPVLSIFDTVCP